MPVSLANRLAKLKNTPTTRIHSLEQKFKNKWHPEALGLTGTKKPQLENADNDPVPPASTSPATTQGSDPSPTNSFQLSNKLKTMIPTLRKVIPEGDKLMNKVKNLGNKAKTFKELRNFWESKTKKARKNRRSRKNRKNRKTRKESRK